MGKLFCPTVFSPYFFVWVYLIFNLLPRLFLKILFIYFWREGKGGRKRERETSMCGCLSRALHWEPGLQPRCVPWLGIKPATLWFTARHSIHWATPARATSSSLNENVDFVIGSWGLHGDQSELASYDMVCVCVCTCGEKIIVTIFIYK